MAYHTYTTEAVVCGSFASHTADKSFLLFTKEAGMIYATAKSVREERSRQRYALQDFSLISVSLVRGRTGWRIGSVSGQLNYFSKSDSREARGSVVRVIKSLRRYIQGEEPHPILFTEIVKALELLSAPRLERRHEYETIVLARLLQQLGYIPVDPELQPLFSAALTDLEPMLSPASLDDITELVTAAEAASHLK